MNEAVWTWFWALSAAVERPSQARERVADALDGNRLAVVVGAGVLL